jgi:hypothetical protein
MRHRNRFEVGPPPPFDDLLDDPIGVARPDVELGVLAQRVDQPREAIAREFGELLVGAPQGQDVELAVLVFDPDVGRQVVVRVSDRVEPGVAAAVALGGGIDFLLPASRATRATRTARTGFPGASGGGTEGTCCTAPTAARLFGLSRHVLEQILLGIGELVEHLPAHAREQGVVLAGGPDHAPATTSSATRM